MYRVYLNFADKLEGNVNCCYMLCTNFDILLTVRLNIFILILTNLMH